MLVSTRMEHDVSVNNKETQKWLAECIKIYTLAAGQDDAYAQYRLGNMYEYGKDFPCRDYPKALEYYKNAASQDFATAMYRIGVFYNEGRGVARNFERAIAWFTEAAEQGHGKAQAQLGQMYYYGEDPYRKVIPHNYEKAREWTATACESYRNAINQLVADALSVLGDKGRDKESIRNILLCQKHLESSLAMYSQWLKEIVQEWNNMNKQ